MLVRIKPVRSENNVHVFIFDLPVRLDDRVVLNLRISLPWSFLLNLKSFVLSRWRQKVVSVVPHTDEFKLNEVVVILVLASLQLELLLELVCGHDDWLGAIVSVVKERFVLQHVFNHLSSSQEVVNFFSSFAPFVADARLNDCCETCPVWRVVSP